MKHLLYLCDPEKNINCTKESCYINNGPCSSTTKPEFAFTNENGEPIGDEVMTLSNWIVEKYFIKCKNCDYEIIIGDRHTAPRKCPNCNAVMMEAMEKEEK